MWSKEVVGKSINKLRSEVDKGLALKIQLHFRAKVLQTKRDLCPFFMSSRGKMEAVNNLVDSLIKVIDFVENFCNRGADDSVFPRSF